MLRQCVRALRSWPQMQAAYENEEKDLYDDPNLHLLAFDMIYSSQVYHLYDGIFLFTPQLWRKRNYTVNALRKLAS